MSISNLRGTQTKRGERGHPGPNSTMVTTFGCAEKGDGTLVVRGKGQLKGFETGIAEFIGGII